MLKCELFQIQIYVAIELKWPLKVLLDFVMFCPGFWHFYSLYHKPALLSRPRVGDSFAT